MERIGSDKTGVVCCRPHDPDNEVYCCYECAPDVVNPEEEDIVRSAPQMIHATIEEVLDDPTQRRKVVHYLAEMCTETNKDMPEPRVRDAIWSTTSDTNKNGSDEPVYVQMRGLWRQCVLYDTMRRLGPK